MKRFRLLRLFVLALAMLCPGFCGCFPRSRSAEAGQVAPGASPKPRPIAPGVFFYEASQPTAVGTRVRLWVYLPSQAVNTQAVKKRKLPCVAIAPAGSPLIWGMDLGAGDRPEHLPYVRAGFIVVAYSIDGAVPEHPTDAQILAGLQAFRHAHAGVSDAFAAIDYALAHLPVDPHRLFVAGHSSAGTLALLTAENDPRVKACVAYAPACDLLRRNAQTVTTLQPLVPDIADFLTRTSPITRASALHCPLFLFHADDDSNVPTSDVRAFRDRVAQTNGRVTFSQVASGEHYESMRQVGIPRAIAWLKALP